MTQIYFNIPLLFLHRQDWIVLDSDGVLHTMNAKSAQDFLKSLGDTGVIVCHSAFITLRLKVDAFQAMDILELWAFVYPARPVVPTISGILHTLDMYPSNDTPENMAGAIMRAITFIVESITSESGKPSVESMVASLGKTGWGWAKPLMHTLQMNTQDFIAKPFSDGLDIWNRLPKWEKKSPPPQAGTHPVYVDDISTRLRTFLGTGAEDRPEQVALSQALCPAFQPKENDTPNIVIAEGATGVGKTYAYLAPATVWAEKNDAPVWISTYTRNLQHQIYNQVKSLYPNDQDVYKRVVLCKGRENYVCISRFQTLTQHANTDPRLLKSLVLLARWIEHSLDGDMNGMDFPSWLSAVVDVDGTLLKKLTVQYDVGETHTGCLHREKCFVDMPLKRAKYADVVITNHAFILHRAKLHLENQETDLIPHVVFDEGHHLFEACDSAFSTEFSAWGTYMLRRFIINKDTGDLLQQSKGTLGAIIDNVYDTDNPIHTHRIALQHHAHILTDNHWQSRFTSTPPTPQGDMEYLFLRIEHYIYNNADDKGYDLEIATHDLPDDIRTTAYTVMEKLRDMLPPARDIVTHARKTLETRADTLGEENRIALRNLISNLEWRIINPVNTWCDVLITIAEPSQKKSDDTVDRMYLERRHVPYSDTPVVSNVGINRHMTDPMQAFCNGVLQSTRGAVITSATLQDASPDWIHIRTGARHLPSPPIITTHPSPFAYDTHAKVCIVTDVNKHDTSEVAGAYTSLFCASQGGGLGLFTNIKRLKITGQKIRNHLAPKGISVYAQHLDDMNITTLVNIFKQDTHSCLLGTDAVRDGVDITGDSLRLMVLDRMPWTIQSIVHTHRKKAFQDADYQNAIIRTKLQQAFGRLIRTKTDRGVFVILETVPSRFHSAFPDTVPIVTCTLAQACQHVTDFY